MSWGGTPAGWYPDPAGTGHRYWDGGRWTDQVVAAAPRIAAPRPAVALADEEPLARWARGALLVAPVAQVAAAVVTRHEFRELLDRMGDFMSGSNTAQPISTTTNVSLQLLGAVVTITGLLFLMWFARSARNAAALGLAARREPAAAVAGFVVPIINLWWPYQSTCDLLPDDTARFVVLRWFLLWVVGGFASAVVTVAAAFVPSPVGWAVLAVPATLLLLAALAARQVISVVVEAHHSLASHLGLSPR